MYIIFEAVKLREISGFKRFMQSDLELLYHHGSGSRWIVSKNRVKPFHLSLLSAACLLFNSISTHRPVSVVCPQVGVSPAKDLPN